MIMGIELNNLVIHLLTETEEKPEILSDIYDGMVYRIMYGYIYDSGENKWYQDLTNKGIEELKF